MGSTRPDKRTRLIETAVKLAYRNGFRETSLADIAQALFSEPMGWLEEQFRSAGHGQKSRGYAVHTFCAFQGIAAVTHGANDPEVAAMEARRLKDWISSL